MRIGSYYRRAHDRRSGLLSGLDKQSLSRFMPKAFVGMESLRMLGYRFPPNRGANRAFQQFLQRARAGYCRAYAGAAGIRPAFGRNICSDPQRSNMGFAEGELTTIIVTHNSALVLADCLAALAGCSAGQVLVVDNASSDNSVELARAAGAQVHELGYNLGFARAANHGARVAQSEFLCFLNPDCIVEAGLPQIAAQALRQNARCVALPDFLHEDGTIVRGCQPGYTWKKLLADIIDTNRGWPRVVKLIKRLPEYDDRNWQWPLCACAFIPRDLFFEAGGFDEQYFLYMEDVELGMIDCPGGRRHRGAQLHGAASRAARFRGKPHPPYGVVKLRPGCSMPAGIMENVLKDCCGF